MLMLCLYSYSLSLSAFSSNLLSTIECSLLLHGNTSRFQVYSFLLWEETPEVINATNQFPLSFTQNKYHSLFYPQKRKYHEIVMNKIFQLLFKKGLEFELTLLQSRIEQLPIALHCPIIIISIHVLSGGESPVDYRAVPGGARHHTRDVWPHWQVTQSHNDSYLRDSGSLAVILCGTVFMVPGLFPN